MQERGAGRTLKLAQLSGSKFSHSVLLPHKETIVSLFFEKNFSAYKGLPFVEK